MRRYQLLCCCLLFGLSGFAWAQGNAALHLTECEVDQCTRASGVGDWVFQGAAGKARWPFGATANMQIVQFDAKTVVIQRSDTGNYTPGLTAVYRGTRNGSWIEGDVVWTWPGHWKQPAHGVWHALIEGPASTASGIHYGLATGCPTNMQWPPTPPHNERWGPDAPAGSPDPLVRADQLVLQENYAEALNLYRQSAASGNFYAMRRLGVMYYRGFGTPKNYAEAMHWSRLAAGAGDTTAMRYVGKLYDKGYGVPQSPQDAARWDRAAAAAGNPDAQADMAARYEKGDGVAVDHAEVLRLSRLAAEGGSDVGMFNYGFILRDGKGTPIDYVRALHWFRLAAALGLPEAFETLGDMSAGDLGTQPDLADAMCWYRLSADRGFALAMNNLGTVYEHGFPGFAPQPVEAARWYQKAADAGDDLGMTNLGSLYYRGRGVPRNGAMAISWTEKAIAAGSVAALYNMGIMYEQGRAGIPQNYSHAMHFFLLAANQNYAAAMNNIGAMYQNGEGVPANRVIAVGWYTKAAQLGDPTAKINLTRIAADVALGLIESLATDDDGDEQ
jgi:TPR repeat protein